jgi:hypothetical protein
VALLALDHLPPLLVLGKRKSMGRETVVVIGCGPSSLFFQKSLAMRPQQLEQEGNASAIASLPNVTIFERSSSPEGVWRAKKTSDQWSSATYGIPTLYL